MLRAIDQFIAAMRRENGDEVLFVTGGPVRVRSGEQMRVLLAQPVRADQIQAILAPVVPATVDQGFTSDGDATFTVETTDGPVSIQLHRVGSRLDAVLRPVGAQAATPATSTTSKPRPPTQAASSFADVMSSFVQVAKAGPPTPPAANTARAEPPAPQQPPVTMTPAMPAPTAPVANTARAEPPAPQQPPVTMTTATSAPTAPAANTARAEPPAPQQPPVAMTPAMPAPTAAAAGRKQMTMTTAMPAPTAAAAGRKQIDPMLQRLVTQKASDLHITAGMPPRMRKDGDMGALPGFEGALSSDAIRIMLMEMAPPFARAKLQKTNEADFAYEIAGLARFRINAFKDRRGMSGVLRMIPATILTVEELNLPSIVRDLCLLESGLVLVTGPTGSGKSTTLAAMVDFINKNRSDHIITIEDPVEFVHEALGCMVNQREVHVDTPSFAAALRAALREDPNIVLIGEMRDLRTVAIAIETAKTGHLVLATLHTTTAVGSIDHIIDQFAAKRQQQIRMMLSESLRGVITQTLCKKIGGGRVAAFEILVGTAAVSNLIREGKTFQIPSLMQMQAGMLTLNDALFALVKEGVVTADEALHKSVDRSSFKAMLDRAGVTLEKDGGRLS